MNAALTLEQHNQIFQLQKGMIPEAALVFAKLLHTDVNEADVPDYLVYLDMLAPICPSCQGALEFLSAVTA